MRIPLLPIVAPSSMSISHFHRLLFPPTLLQQKTNIFLPLCPNMPPFYSSMKPLVWDPPPSFYSLLFACLFAPSHWISNCNHPTSSSATIFAKDVVFAGSEAVWLPQSRWLWYVFISFLFAWKLSIVVGNQMICRNFLLISSYISSTRNQWLKSYYYFFFIFFPSKLLIEVVDLKPQ